MIKCIAAFTHNPSYKIIFLLNLRLEDHPAVAKTLREKQEKIKSEAARTSLPTKRVGLLLYVQLKLSCNTCITLHLSGSSLDLDNLPSSFLVEDVAIHLICILPYIVFVSQKLLQPESEIASLYREGRSPEPPPDDVKPKRFKFNGNTNNNNDESKNDKNIKSESFTRASFLSRYFDCLVLLKISLPFSMTCTF